MAFGSPTRYLQLDPNLVPDNDAECGSGSVGGNSGDSSAVGCANAWDRAVERGNEVYAKRMHNLCFDNCHSHVAHCLNVMHYRRSDGYRWTVR